MCFHENEAEYGSAKIVRVLSENEGSITFVLEEQISSNFRICSLTHFKSTYRNRISIIPIF